MIGNYNIANIYPFELEKISWKMNVFKNLILNLYNLQSMTVFMAFSEAEKVAIKTVIWP